VGYVEGFEEGQVGVLERRENEGWEYVLEVAEGEGGRRMLHIFFGGGLRLNFNLESRKNRLVLLLR
jgi:hypothetical protein